MVLSNNALRINRECTSRCVPRSAICPGSGARPTSDRNRGVEGQNARTPSREPSLVRRSGTAGVRSPLPRAGHKGSSPLWRPRWQTPKPHQTREPSTGASAASNPRPSNSKPSASLSTGRSSPQPKSPRSAPCWRPFAVSGGRPRETKKRPTAKWGRLLQTAQYDRYQRSTPWYRIGRAVR